MYWLISLLSSGDGRVNENVALTAVHTTMARLHNMYAEELHALNPDWSGERLYQTCRHIIAAILQHITFNEFLPILLGSDTIHKYGLQLSTSGYLDGAQHS